MGGGDRRTQAEEQEKFLEQQIKDRPLLHMQQQLEKEDGDPTDVGNEKTEENSDGIEHTHERHHLLKDDDEELAYLESHLTGLHKAFYDEYDRARANAQGGRVAYLRPGSNKKISLRDETDDLKIVPDIREVMPRLK